VATCQRKAQADPSIQAPCRRRQGGTVGASPAITLPSTGLLIPRLHADVPTSFAGDAPGAMDYVKQLVEIGALTPDSAGDNPEDLVQLGIDALTSLGVEGYENGWGGEGWVQIHIGEGGINMSMYQRCHEWRIRLKPIVTAMPADEALVFIEALHNSVVQGPSWWVDIIGFGDHDEDGVGEQNPDAPNPDPEESKKWLDGLFSSYPCLVGKERGQTLMEIMVPNSKTKTPPELRALIDEFIAATAESKPYEDNTALLTTTWDKDCYINHAHDYLCNEINEGNLTDQDGYPFAFHAKSIKELAEGLNKIGRFIAAATKLEEYSNANC
jgi:hypothetical protein